MDYLVLNYAAYLLLQHLPLETTLIKCQTSFSFLSTCFSMLVHCIQVLEGVIKYRWNALPAEQRDGMKNFISDIIVQVSALFGESSYLS
jgi:hypothetical protein